MKNFQGYKTISEYQKNSAEIITTNIDIPNIYNRIVVLSTLNTGVNPYDNNIIEISCMELMGGKITGYEFDAFLHPRYTINEVIKQKTNLNNNFYEDFFDGVYSSDKNVMIQFKKFVKQSRIIIFNSLKEIDFINNELNYHKIGSFQKNRFYSLINIFRQMFPHASQNILTLNKCCEFLEIQIPKEKYHSSKHDCFIACKILAKLYDIINNTKINKEKKSLEKNDKNLEKNGINEEKKINLINNINGISDRKISSPINSNSKNSEYEFDYPDSLIDMIEEENRNDNENISDNIVLNNSGGKIKKLELNGNKKDIKLIGNKRKIEFQDLVNNLKSKVIPCKIEDELKINFDPNELNFEK
jgi:DNA polymerase III epsilon subunit-like protein